MKLMDTLGCTLNIMHWGNLEMFACFITSVFFVKQLFNIFNILPNRNCLNLRFRSCAHRAPWEPVQPTITHNIHDRVAEMFLCTRRIISLQWRCARCVLSCMLSTSCVIYGMKAEIFSAFETNSWTHSFVTEPYTPPHALKYSAPH